MNRNYATLRAELWIKTWVAYTQADNSTKPETGFVWADKAVREFDQRFKETLDTEEKKE